MAGGGGGKVRSGEEEEAGGIGRRTQVRTGQVLTLTDLYKQRIKMLTHSKLKLPVNLTIQRCTIFFSFFPEQQGLIPPAPASHIFHRLYSSFELNNNNIWDQRGKE